MYGDSQIKDPVVLQPLPITNAPPPPRRRSVGGIKVTQPKYNLFSILDEPFNNILRGGSCTCPANELIASQRTEANWENIKKNNDDGIF